ncbi:helix-turn-helix transcriptional regulator [Streptomyces sp. NRRL S-4]|uniref:helix-turn-helix transcriptional regulator n=1 Tax=Streptomyces sp. NRRL S-4 TaxID=1519471 RepID=UPI0006B576EF|nr:LuxR family transcriptional regulator [Streptomyces sp. NRRL S-4]
MVTAPEHFWSPRLRRTLAGDCPAPVLLLVEGFAGTGKTGVVQDVVVLAEAAGAGCLRLVCGEPAAPLELPGEGPVLIAVEDVHRADAGELGMIRRLLERPRPGMAFVLTYRPEELADSGLPLGTPPPRYPPAMTVLRHRIRPWNTEEVRRVTAEALGERCTDETVARLHERSGGVAQVVADLLTVLRDSTGQRCTAADVDAAGVPVRLADLSLGRTAGLQPEHRPIVWAAAVLGEPASRDDLVAVSGLGRAVGREALLAALAGAALAESAEGYGIPVPLAGTAVYESVPGPVRQELHSRAAEVLGHRRPVPWAALARHRRAGGRIRGWLRAVEQAAREAADSGRHQEASSLLEDTLASPAVPPGTRARLAPILARSAVVGLRSDQTVRVLTQIVDDAALPAAVRGELRLDLGLLLCNQVGMTERGWQELERAAAELREDRPDLSARAMSALVMPHWPRYPVDVHQGWLQEAAATAEESGDDAARSAVAANRVSLAMSCGDPRAWELAGALPTDTTDPRSRLHAARGLCNAADAAVWLGHPERAQHLLTEGIALSNKSGAPYTEHTALGTRLRLEWVTGRWAGLDNRCEDFVASTAAMPVISADARLVRGLLALAGGEWDAAHSWLAGGDSAPRDETAPPLAAATSGGLIRLALARQELPAAAQEAREAWARARQKGIWAWAADLAPWAVEALARSGAPEEARHMIAEFTAGLESRDAPLAVGALLWSRAALAEAEGRLSDAVPLYGEAAAAYASVPSPYFQALTSEAAGRCALAGTGADDLAGEAPWAVADLIACTRQFTELGAVWDAARTRALLRSHQPAKEAARQPGRPSYGDRLSPREREVAELAGTGLTNREIAMTLHLSPRTVEQHVARAMRKLGTTSRRRLAQLIGTSVSPAPVSKPANGG